MKKNKKININVNIDDFNLSYCWNEFGEMPSVIKIYEYYDLEFFENLINISSYKEGDFENKFSRLEVFDNKSVYLSYKIYYESTPIVSEVTFYYLNMDISSILENLNNFIINDEAEINLDYDMNLEYITINEGLISTEYLPFKKIDKNIKMYYDKNILKSIKKLSNKIKSTKSGLTILYGEKGNGKTTSIKLLISKLKRKVLYLPNNLIEYINNPDFIKFLQSYEDSIIIIDDCDYVFNNLYVKTNSYTNNILQYLDGLIKDILNVNFIMIFNSNIDEIDENLINCNSLIDIIEFDKLNIEKANELSKHLGYKGKFKTKTSIIDIINDRDIIEPIKIGLK